MLIKLVKITNFFCPFIEKDLYLANIMKTKFQILLFFIAILSFSTKINSQSFWKKISLSKNSFQKKEIYQKNNIHSEYNLVSLDLENYKKVFNSKRKSEGELIKLPNLKGEESNFIIKEESNFTPALAKKFPQIKAYSAYGIDDPTARAKISIGTDGFHAVVYSKKQKTLYIDPYTKDSQTLIVHKKSRITSDKQSFFCKTYNVAETFSKTDNPSNTFNKYPNDGKLYTFRLAMICSGEYSQYHLEDQNIDQSASDITKKTTVLSALNTAVTRLNGVFERDLAIRFVLVDNSEDIIFLDKDTDDITNGDVELLIDESQKICDAIIGKDNYDIGHILGTGGGGLASANSVCKSDKKAKGVTSISSPIGYHFVINYLAHEIGHQFGARHTQNNSSCNRHNSTAVEPGSASTIMGYGGFCSPNVQDFSDDYFHVVSIEEILNTIQSTATCAVVTSTGNNPPTANAGKDYSIPKSTPFVLRGSASDIDGTSSLTYCWEQIDSEEGEEIPPESTNTLGPMFRSFLPDNSPDRYMPKIETVISEKGSSTWEVVPSVAREMNFSFLVRDNNEGGGNIARDDKTITVTDAEPFTVLTPNSAVSWEVGSVKTITWNKGISDIAPINCSKVNIKLSTDGGLTFPITLKNEIENDGSEEIIIPDYITSTARIMVEAADNIFYNINSTNFSIINRENSVVKLTSNVNQFLCNFNEEVVSFKLNFDFLDGFSEDVKLSASIKPTDPVVTFNPTIINKSGDVTVNVSNINENLNKSYILTIALSSLTLSKNVNVELTVNNGEFETISLKPSPLNGKTDVKTNTALNWTQILNATSYDIIVASDSDFSTIIHSENVTTNSYPLLNLIGDTTYYWKVKPKNNCGEGKFSDAFSFKTAILSYCKSLFTDGISGKEYISRVKFNTINNSSNKSTEDGYQDFTEIKTSVNRANEYEISVSINTGGYQDHCYVFIDWNQDYEFDNLTERYDLGTVLEDEETKTLNIRVPDDAKFGDTRMRVLIEYITPPDEYGTGACDSNHLSEWGETEDYTIVVGIPHISNSVFENFNLYPNPASTKISLNFKVIDTSLVSVQLYDLRGRLVEEKKYTNTEVNFSKIIEFKNYYSGLYFMKITNKDKHTFKKIIFNIQ